MIIKMKVTAVQGQDDGASFAAKRIVRICEIRAKMFPNYFGARTVYNIRAALRLESRW